MAKLNLHVEIDMDDLAYTDLPYLIAYGDVTSKTSTRYSVLYRDPIGYTESITFTGTGFGNYSNNVPTTGQVTGFTYQFNGKTFFTMSEAAISVQELTSYVLNDDIFGLFARVYGGADSITGSTGSDHVYGFAGNDLMNGGAGADYMEGGIGSDTYVIDNAYDVAIEWWGEGLDQVLSSVTHQLDYYVENLTLTGLGKINGIGNDAANVIVGNDNANRLDGRQGADTLKGAGGNDVYVIEIAGDRVIEASAAGGVDRVETQLSYTLGTHVEDLTLLGGAHVNGTGNSLDNRIVGSSGNNTLNGSGGADHLAGGNGSDTYIVDNLGDLVVEASSAGGVDAVRSRVSFTLGQYVENLTLTGTAVANGIGNDLANLVVGNSAGNRLEGLAGNDRLEGESGNDVLKGGLGADKFVFGTTALSGTANVDKILDFSAVDDRILLNRNAFTAFFQDGQIAESAFHLGTGAHDADDRVIYNQVTGQIFYDSDGMGGATRILFAQVTAGSDLTNLDFFTYTG